MANYVVYQHNVPKVSDDGKVIPIAPHETKEFTDLAEAKKFAGEKKDKFDRITLMAILDDKRSMVERYMDGVYSIPEPKKEPEPPKELAAAEAEAETEATETEEDAN